MKQRTLLAQGTRSRRLRQVQRRQHPINLFSQPFLKADPLLFVGLLFIRLICMSRPISQRVMMNLLVYDFQTLPITIVYFGFFFFFWVRHPDEFHVVWSVHAHLLSRFERGSPVKYHDSN